MKLYNNITHTHTQAHTQAMQVQKGSTHMQDAEFIAFVMHAGASKGSLTFNLHTQNASKKAVEALANSKYKVLAKSHINTGICDAYKHNAEFKEKLDAVMKELNIEIVA